MDPIIQDVRVGLRHLRRDKAFTVTAALTLAVCLAANTAPHTIVGVMPRSFTFIDDGVMAWRALAFTDRQKSDRQRHNNSWQSIGRLKPGATVAQAQAQIDALNAANLERFPEMKRPLTDMGFHTRVERLQDYLIGHVKATLYLLWGGALFVLLIGCVNVAGLVLIRSRARLKDLATRVALGASSGQLARQLVTETAMLTLGSAAAGLALGYALLLSLGAVSIQALPRGSQIAFDAGVATYAVGLAIVLALVLGCVPLVAAVRANVTTVLRAEGRTGSVGHGARTLRRGLVVAQMGLTFVLIVGAGLLFASFRRVLAIDRGRVGGVPRARGPRSQGRSDGGTEVRMNVAGAVGTTGRSPLQTA